MRWAVYPVYGAVCLMLVLVEALGHISGGSQRWLTLGPLVLPLSEQLKFLRSLVLRRVLRSRSVRTFPDLPTTRNNRLPSS